VVHRNPTLRRVGLIIFFIAILFGVILTLVRAVPDLEANLYGFIKYGYPRLYSLSCPVLMTTRDRGSVTIRLKNTLERNLSYYVQTQLSTPSLMDTHEQRLDLSPGESRKISWDVTEVNIDLGNFILAHAFTSAATARGMRESTCGTLVLNLPFQGAAMVYYFLFFLTVIGIAVGLWVWIRYRDLSNPADRVRYGWMFFIAAVVLAGMITSYFNFWFAAILMIFLTLLTSTAYLISQKE